MKKLLLLSFIALIYLTASAQNPAIIWQNTFGGSQSDMVSVISPTSDGGYIIGGNSVSNISGDKTQDAKGSWDLWIVKMSGTGILEWEKTIGGSGVDMLRSIFQTEDGGYFVSAESGSGISGDKTQGVMGSSDYWILKLDATGAIVWQHSYGGAGSDYTPKALQTSDGGYIVAGSSNSGISGNKTDPSKGDYDIWILRLDANGSIVWQKTIGGNKSDILKSIAHSNEGGFIINASSYSDISGDKSESAYGTDDFDDYWVIKLTADGIIQWEKTLGGTAIEYAVNAIPAMDGGYLVGGYSNSPASGDKSENQVGKFDFWVVKLNSSGAVVWDKTMGGSMNDFLTDVKELSDGSFFVSGSSESDVSGDKTDPLQGYVDNWFVQISSSGDIIGQQAIGGDLYDYPESVVLTPDGGFVVASTSDSNTAGDKTQDSHGTYDYWVFKMAPFVVGVSDRELKASISIYPNPSMGDFTIDLGKEYSGVTIEISNILGQVITSVEYASAKTIKQKISTPAGIYFVKVRILNEGSRTLRMIKQ